MSNVVLYATALDTVDRSTKFGSQSRLYDAIACRGGGRKWYRWRGWARGANIHNVLVSLVRYGGPRYTSSPRRRCRRA